LLLADFAAKVSELKGNACIFIPGIGLSGCIAIASIYVYYYIATLILSD